MSLINSLVTMLSVPLRLFPVIWIMENTLFMRSGKGNVHVAAYTTIQTVKASEDVFAQSSTGFLRCLILVVTVSTANHYVLDTAAGFVAASIAWNIRFKFIS
ncbi:hypothetical protein B0H14DRAFT_3521301 [Mycena olivaceomarginata]|nr:hypothetical protein B0H14DRAFT_3521301 [Mycena olivaceomarginata]